MPGRKAVWAAPFGGSGQSCGINPPLLFAAFLGPHSHQECRPTDRPTCSEQFLWARIFLPPWSWYLDIPAKVLVKGRPLCMYLLNVDWSARPADQK